MATMQGITGKLSGKYGNAVFRIRRGTQVMAQYNPVVENPNTGRQVNARARFKLMAQLAAVFAEVIAIPREGSKTPRNLFVKRNFPIVSANNGKAEIDLPQVQITKSSREMPAFTVSRSTGTDIGCSLIEAAAFARVVWVVIAKNANENLRVFASAVVENLNPSEPNTFATKLPYTSEAIVVYAYGMTDTGNNASALFGDIFSPTAQDVATLIASRSLSTTDVVMTATGGAYLEVGTNDAVSEAAGGGGEGLPQVPTIGGYSPFAEFTEVALNAQNGASIYYTTDGTTPTTASTLYDGTPIRIDRTTTFKAIAVVNGVSSYVTTRTLVKEDAPVVVMAPTINGTTPFAQSTVVTMSAEAGAQIFYTDDGTTPDENSHLYSNTITVSETTTFKAIARLQNTNSAVTTRTFTKSGGGGSGDE